MSLYKGWIGVDLDGTLASYEGGWRGPGHIGEPIPKMVERVKRLISEGEYEVRIFTARAAHNGRMPTDRKAIEAIEDWCEKHIGTRLRVTCTKDRWMEALWDDRAVQVATGTGETLQDIVDRCRDLLERWDTEAHVAEESDEERAHFDGRPDTCRKSESYRARVSELRKALEGP